MTSTSTLQQKFLIEKYYELEAARKSPIPALYNGKLIIYAYKTDSLIGKIQQFVSCLFLQLSRLFGNSLVFNLNNIDAARSQVEEKFSRLSLEEVQKSKQPEIAALLHQIKERETALANLQQQLQEAQSTHTSLSLECESLRDERGKRLSRNGALNAKYEALRKKHEEALELVQRLGELQNSCKSLAEEEERRKKEAAEWTTALNSVRTTYLQDEVVQLINENNRLKNLSATRQQHSTPIPLSAQEVHSMRQTSTGLVVSQVESSETAHHKSKGFHALPN